ncbi:MAG: hypothetical protein BAJALOKI1v1_440019 [Promethearchaeota archaeon]|nr:MAG: hypothetical protein BAJALOKI1v1_440019 [Candidatus Lokiarchaeota archaeon]
MNIPSLKHIEVSNLIPFDPRGGEINIDRSIAVFQKDNSKGKTTFFQAIELSLFRDITGGAYDFIKGKRYNINDNPIIKTIWEIQEDENENTIEIEIEQEITDRGLHSHMNGNKLNKEVFHKNIRNIIDLPVSITKLHKLFNLLIFYPESIEVQEKKYSLIMNWNEFINDFLPLIISDRTEQQLRIRLNELEDSLQSLKANIDKNQNKLEKMERITNDYDNTLLQIRRKKLRRLERIQEREQKIQNKINEMSEYNVRFGEREEFLKLIEEYQINQEKILTLENKIDLKSNTENQEHIATIFNQETSISDTKRNFEREHFPYCPLCGYSIIRNWERNIRNHKCPICKLEYELMPENTRKELIALQDFEDVIEIERRQIEASLQQLEEEKENLENRNKTIRNMDFLEGLSLQMEDYRIIEEREQNNKKMQYAINYINKLNEKFRLNSSIRRNTEQDLQSYNSIIEAYENLEDIEHIQENLIILETEKERLEDDKANIETNLAEFGNRDTLIESLHEYFKDEGERLLNYRFTFDFDNKTIRLPNDTSKPLESTSEFNLMEFWLRILVWKYLVENNYINKGFMVLDNPEIWFDDDNLRKFRSIINQTSDIINFVITSKNEFRGNNIQQISLTTTQRSIMDFINL